MSIRGYILAKKAVFSRLLIFTRFLLPRKGKKRCFEDILSAGHFYLYLYVIVLKEYVDQRARYVFNTCNDTRNYGSRLNVVNNHGQLIIYGESFRFDKPELCEYLQIEISNEKTVFSVSNSSRFLEQYLGRDSWYFFYGSSPSNAFQRFENLDEVTDAC